MILVRLPKARSGKTLRKTLARIVNGKEYLARIVNGKEYSCLLYTSMESILSNDYSLKLFNDSSEALEYAFANPPDLILLDVMMPKIDGFEICRRLKANPKLSDVPVIFITSKTDIEDEERGFSVGASDFIHKPILSLIHI